MNDPIFSLDIGTRKIGMFATRHYDEHSEVLVARITEHTSRAVRAGQIHDIDKVAALVSEIKSAVEKESGQEIKKVATAIAGRNLKSMRTTGEIRFDASREITENELRQAELLAIQDAVNRSGEETDDYLFVGHTVVSWQIDGEMIVNPLNHYSSSLKTEIITTFLPKKVLESLFAVAKKAGLEISYLTLEPIAAAESVLPQEMRHIPLVLVDIGAGTSDIALVCRGSIQSFGMIPVAGDFVTEYICGELLVDFPEAERIKKYAGNGAHGLIEPVKYKDIFTKEYEKNTQELKNIFSPAVKELAEKIASEIKLLVSNPEAQIKNYAVVLVGGGSLTGGLPEELAANLGIPQSRVGLRSPAMVNRFVLNLQRIKELQTGENGNSNLNDVFGPQTAVLLGTSCLAAKMPSAALIHVTLNNNKYEIINFKEGGITVLSALVAAGISRLKISGRVGLAKVYTLNGAPGVIKGSLPEPAKIVLNGERADIGTVLKEGDRIEFVPASDGSDARAKVADIMPAPEEFELNGKKYKFNFKILVNGKEALLDSEITDNAKITVQKDDSIISALAAAGISAQGIAEQNVSFNVLGQTVAKQIKNCVIKINGNEIRDLNELRSAKVIASDEITYESVKPVVRAGELISVPEKGRDLKIKINEEEFTFPGSHGKIILNGREVSEDAEVSDGDILRTVSGRDAEAVLVDIFRYISLEPRDTAGKRLKLLVNQQEANFTTPLSYDADVRISFE